MTVDLNLLRYYFEEQEHLQIEIYGHRMKMIEEGIGVIQKESK